jgi:hypothetical protein
VPQVPHTGGRASSGGSWACVPEISGGSRPRLQAAGALQQLQ